jgi:23S rRNA maturation-related 3'-5' exoribonuclease YhaM
MKDKIIELLRSTGRKGMGDLIVHMDEIGFFTAPCSSQYHLCKVGGLAEHSLNVWEFMNYTFCASKHTKDIPINSQIIASLLHDLGKAAYHGKPNYVPNILKGGEISKAKPFETNKDLPPFDHAYKSCMIASKFIELTEDEEFAIRYHDGLYVPSGRDIQGKERPLQLLLHFSDMYCSRFIEKEGE